MQTLVKGGERVIEDLSFDEDKKCYKISAWDLPTFLNHQETEYAVAGLFSKIEKSWFNVDFLGIDVDH